MKTIRIGMMSYAHVHAPQYIPMLQAMEGVVIVGLADEDHERAEEARVAHGIEIFESYDALLAQPLDAVIVSSENARHREHVELAAAKGLTILCEKPLATTGEDAAAMVEACHAAGARLMVAFPMRFSEPLSEVLELMHNGELGDIQACEGVNQGQLPRHRRSWFVDPVLAGGGAVTDHTVHLVDALRWMLDDEVVEVYAQANDFVGGEGMEVETSGLVMLTFSRGTVATVDCSWNRSMTYPTWGGLGMRFVALNAGAGVDASSQLLVSYDDAAGKVSAMDCSQSAYQAMLEHFVAAVRGDVALTPTGTDGLRAVEVVDAAYRSIREGQPVRCERISVSA